jgi:hypothetical protein
MKKCWDVMKPYFDVEGGVIHEGAGPVKCCVAG